MQCEALKHAPLTCEGFGGFKRGIRGRLRNLSPLVTLLNKKKFTNLIKLSLQILKLYSLALADY